MTATTLETPTILPPSPDASLAEHFKAANELHKQGKLREAADEVRRALQIKPNSPEAHYNLANIVRDAGEPALALQGFQAAIDHAKAKRHVYPDALVNMGDVLRRLGRYDEAAEAVKEAIRLQPKRVEAHIGLGLILLAQGKLSASVSRLEKATEVGPDNAGAFFQLGIARHWSQRWEEALQAYDRVIKLNPDFLPVRIERARTLFRLGRFAEGFAEYESRLQSPNFRKPEGLKPSWNGKQGLKGKTILVMSEPGFIDEIQFARYIPLLAKKGAKPIVMVQEPLRQLFASLLGVASVLELNQPLPEHDVSVPLMSLPHLMGTTAETIPSGESYLTADSAQVAAFAKRLEGVAGKKIGIAWIGANPSGTLHGKALAPEQLAPLAALQDVSLISLQQRQADEELPGIHSPGLLSDFAQAAGLIANLDMVISVDAAVAHLAGAMGKPVWLLLPVIPDAPWSPEGDKSQWYPSMRIFRQRRKGNWDEVIKRVTRELAAAG